MGITLTEGKPICREIITLGATWTSVTFPAWVRVGAVYNTSSTATEIVRLANRTTNGDGGAVHANDNYQDIPALARLQKIALATGRAMTANSAGTINLCAAAGAPVVQVEGSEV